MANGKIIYDVDGTPTTYIFAKNYSFGHKPGYLDLNSRKRALDGTAYMDAGPVKRFWELEFTGAPLAQKEAFEAAYESGLPIDFYLDADLARTAEVNFDAPPDIESEEKFVDEVYTWAISVRFEET